MVRARGAIAIGLVILCQPAAAWAHGNLRAQDPDAGARLRRPPAVITMTLTESPAEGSVAKVRDGCKRKLPAAVSLDGNDLTLSVSGGEPGTWAVTYRAISAEDGHLTTGGYRFSVTGKRDCSGPVETPGDRIAGGEDTRVEAPEDEGSSFPLIPFALGTVTVVAVAYVLRRAISRQ